MEYRRKMRLLKVKMLDNSVKSIMADDSQVVSNLMVLICQKIGITSHDEYSLIWDKPEDESEKPGKVPFIYYVSTFIAQNLILWPNSS